jgi:hypothetical protein
MRSRAFFTILPLSAISIEIIYLYREVTVYKSRHSRHGAFWSAIRATTYSIYKRE